MQYLGARHISALRAGAFLLGLSLAAAPQAHAQTAPNIDASRVEEQLTRTPAAPPEVVPLPPQPKKAASDAPANADAVRLTLRRVDVQGVIAYAPGEIARVYEKYIGKDVSVADLYQMAADITTKYRADGYVFAHAYLPPQDISEGAVIIAVREPRVSDIVLDGENHAMREIGRTLRPLRNQLLNVNTLEEAMLLVNDIPGISAQSVIEPAPNDAGNGDVQLRISLSEDRFAGSASFDNYGSKYIGPYQLGERFTLNNFFGYASATDLQLFQATQHRELKYGSVSHRVPVLWPGLTAGVSASWSQVRPGGSLRPNDILSQARSVTASASQAIVRSRKMNLNAELSLERRNVYTKLLGERLYDDRLTIGTARAVFDYTDTWRGYSYVDLRLRQGIDILGTRQSGSADLSRIDGRSDFTAWQVELSRLQSVVEDVTLFGSVRGQYTQDPLLSSEEFGFGGAQIGRGYDSSEIVGDKGIAATLEARYNLLDRDGFYLSPYAFYDIGKVWNIDPLDKNRVSAASAGIGLRGWQESGLNFNLTIANPLTKSTESPHYGNGSGPVAKFSLQFDF